MLSKITDSLKSLRSYSCRPYVFVTGCCYPEIENVRASTHDWSRFGIYETSSPENADMLILGGWMNSRVSEVVKEAFALIRHPKNVIVLGGCAISGAPYGMGGEKIICASDIVPVDVFVPGCPPRPELILDAIVELRQNEVGRTATARQFLHRST